ncbi:MAG: M48 family metalloprotease, partial [Planctomycetota bacterium]
MQPLVILLIAAVVIAADAGLSAEDALVPRGDWARLAIAVVPVLAAVGALQLLVQWRLGPRTDPTRPASIMALERATRWVRWFLLAHYVAAVLLFGWLDAVRSFVGNPILVDEVIAMLPVLAGLTAIWWAYWPVERRVRDALLVRRLDEGGPVFPVLGRGAYVLLQLRIQVLLLLVPILLILGLSEAIGAVGRVLALDPGRAWLLDVATFAAAGLVFALAPLLARVLLTVEPLGAGPLRDDLVACCRRHGVRVRRLYVWHTGGTMINAAVMGLVAPLRCVLMTDALLETLPRPHLLAVMAHEIGHVRRHHMPWLVVGLLATLAASVLLVNGTAAALGAAGLPVAGDARWFDAAATVVQAVIALVAFGWICRRFERQADSFAVQ